MSSPPTKSAPASCASRTFSPVAITSTRFDFPSPCGRTTVPRTIWSDCFGSTPRFSTSSTVSSNFTKCALRRSSAASSSLYGRASTNLRARSIFFPPIFALQRKDWWKEYRSRPQVGGSATVQTRRSRGASAQGALREVRRDGGTGAEPRSGPEAVGPNGSRHGGSTARAGKIEARAGDRERRQSARSAGSGRGFRGRRRHGAENPGRLDGLRRRDRDAGHDEVRRTSGKSSRPARIDAQPEDGNGYF